MTLSRTAAGCDLNTLTEVDYAILSLRFVDTVV